jgi:uncharacterized protein YqjF (DUF2071 family)
MTSFVPGAVDPADRLAVRERPAGRAVMHQRWSDLLFLHWRVDPALLTPLLPPGLHLDLHDGEAWIGVVAFRMQRIRPAMVPSVPGLSWFDELNVRLYCHDDDGRPGVWFLSLDCNQPLAVFLGRHLFLLPYQHARMRYRRTPDGHEYHCARRGAAEPARLECEATGDVSEAEPGSLEFFLLERYRLFSTDRTGRLHSAVVHHRPYRYAPAACTRWSTAPVGWDGLPEPLGAPESALYADRVDVEVFPLRRLAATPRG